MIIRAKLTLLATASALVLTGCVTTPGGEQNRTRDGLIVGGLSGAVIGGAVSDSVGGAAIGATVGAIAGGLIGQTLDQQARDLRGSLNNDDIQIINTGSELIVRMPEGILFDFGSAAIRPGLQRDLAVLARNLNDYPNTTVDVIGHTDSVGSAAVNQDLSAARAENVARALARNGVAPSRLRSFGRGENEPIESNLTDFGRQQNRRVEVIIRPIT